MSQDDEETTKSKLNNNHHQYNYNYNHYGQTRQTENNNQQQLLRHDIVVPLYENFILHNNYYNDNKKSDHLLLERAAIKSEPFNNDHRFVRNASHNANTNIQADTTSDINSITNDNYEYESIEFGLKENTNNFDKKLLLQKYFRSALVGPRSNIYENLCRGCNYGVFNARGPLCTFCECIVNGVSALSSETLDDSGSFSTSNNIYENICDVCGVIYSGSAGSECKCRAKSEENIEETFVNVGSAELLLENSLKEGEKPKKKVKLSKSKSFNKSNKPKIFTNFWDSLRKPKSVSGSVARKPLEIIHHVEGYEQVFHTKDTFDLQKICELKRSTTSCSDQHIYGRLKPNDLAISQEEFNSTQSLTQTGAGKKPRLSKAKFLRTQTPAISFTTLENFEIRKELAAATIYLNSSVCHWMTSLRREIHTYNNYYMQQQQQQQQQQGCSSHSNEFDQDTWLCYPKSIPSKSVLISCKAPTVTNQLMRTQNIQNFKNLLQQHFNWQQTTSGDLTELETLITHNSMTSLDSAEIEEVQHKNPQSDCYQLMVEEFMANIINRQMLRTKDSTKQPSDNVKAMAGVNNNNNSSSNSSSSSNDNNNYRHHDISLRQANLSTTLTAQTTTATATNSHRHKRQGIYLRLEDHQLQLQHTGEVENMNNVESKTKHGERVNNIATEFNNNNEYENLNSPGKILLNNNEPNTVTTPVLKFKYLNDDLQTVSRWPKTNKTDWNTVKTDRRRGIHERNVLEAFEVLLELEKTNQEQSNNEQPILDVKPIKKADQESPAVERSAEEATSDNPLQLQTFVATNPLTISQHFPTQIVDIVQLINHQQLASALNTIIICYEPYLNVYLHYIYRANIKTRTFASKIPNKQLVRKFKQFYNYCEKHYSTASGIRAHTIVTRPQTTERQLTCVSSNLKLDLSITTTNGYSDAQKFQTTECNESLTKHQMTANGLKDEENIYANILNTSKTEISVKQQQKIKTPPQVPKRDPKTKLSPTAEIKGFSPKMTVPASNLKTATQQASQQEEESIYQPIWKFETKGKVDERYRTDDDYYDLKAIKRQLQQQSPATDLPKILISDDMLPAEEEDDNNWEPDEEFVFTKQLKKQRSSSLTSDANATIRSTHSSNSSILTTSSLSGSTITEFASSTATLASTLSSSIKHSLFRNIGIFYSLTEPKIKAIIYDYDRVHCSSYFANPPQEIVHKNGNDSGMGKSIRSEQPLKPNSGSASSSPSTSANSSPISLAKRELLKKSNATNSESESYAAAKSCTTPSAAPALIPSCVQAWKYQLLNVNHMEDEEDMIVSECEIIRAQKINDDIDQTPYVPPPRQLTKCRSEEILHEPLDNKKTIPELLAQIKARISPIQKGILNINGRNSPKSEKKIYKLNRANQSTSLYLEDGLKPKYPIFGVHLDRLELQQNVPRFVVDAVDYIERKDRITQDGIYRACGNKFSIDELKQKLTKSYIYDSKLIVADDIHTVTSLLKQFFRDLPEPVIPQAIYSRITTNLADKQGHDTIRIAIGEMKEPNKSTLRFLIKHLTNVVACSSSNRMNASNVAIVWGPSLFDQNDTYDMIGRMNTLTKVLIENFDRIFDTNERLL